MIALQLMPSSSIVIKRARLTSAAAALRERVSACSTRRSSVVRSRWESMPHMILRKSPLQSTRIALEFRRYKLGASVSERNFDQRQAGVNNHTVALPACSVWISVLEVSVRRDIGQRTLNGTAPLFGLTLGETIVP